jgi:sporulation protein YlmC with PRC-barrel domain
VGGNVGGMPDQLHPTRRAAPGTATVVAESVADWRGHDVIDLDGAKLGQLEDVFYDVETDDPMFLLVKVGGLLSKKLALVAVAGATVAPDRLRVNYRKSEIKDAPTYDPDLELTVDQEAGAYQHYGLAYDATGQGARRLARR